MAFVGDWFGMRHFQFFGVPPPFVELSKKPGMSEVPKPTLPGWLSASPFVLITSPNFVWAVAALAVYFLAPYDLSARGTAAQAPLSLAFFAERLPLWLAVTLGYVAFWHVTLYWLRWSDRPLIPSRIFSLGKVLHNVMHSTFGIAQWVVFENVFAFLWATGRLAYLSDSDAASSSSGLAIFIAGLIAIPLWRDGA